MLHGCGLLREIPSTLILDKTGRTIGLAMGPRQWDSRKSIALFEHLIDKYAATSTPGETNPG
jgi:hypothetical protein